MGRYIVFEELPVWQEAARLYHAVLDLLEDRHVRLSPGFRYQLDLAVLSVSNNIAEGFERVTTAELLNLLGIARGSAGEVRSMMAVLAGRPTDSLLGEHGRRITQLAKSCGRQLTAWAGAVEASPIRGRRHLIKTPAPRTAHDAPNPSAS